MTDTSKKKMYGSARDKFLSLSLESTRKSYYPQLKKQLEISMENERHLRMLVDNLPAMIAYVDIDERYVFVNSRYEKTFGLTRDTIVGKRVKTVLGQENYAIARQNIRRTLKGESVNYQFPYSRSGSDGDSQWLDVTYFPDTDAQERVCGFYILTLDQTEKKRAKQEKATLEAQLQQIQKREAIGTLAGGIAHDFNNLLMGILGRASLMSAELSDLDSDREHLQAIEEYVKSAMHLTKQLLGFARGGKYEVKPIKINELITNSAYMFGRTRKEIKIYVTQDSKDPAIEADRSQIEQVLLNMYVNAWQAMPEGGELYLETHTTMLEDAYSQSQGIYPGCYTKITVTDRGVGMDDATCQRVFDPFFTTKEKSRGTGLGLASAYGIIKNHGGTITVYSEIGIGTTFNIYLPCSEKEVLREVSDKKSLATGSGTVLLVDDEEMILDVGQAMLENLGYRVVTAMGGQAAIETLSNRRRDIDLVILDLIMPVNDGVWTFERIREIDPHMRIILSSGYAMDGKATVIMQKGCNGFIQKPFNLHELSRILQQVFGADISESN